METQVLNKLIEAIPMRHSVRNYLPEQVDTAEIEDFFESLNIFPHNARLVSFKAEPGKALYNNGINPPANFALIAQTDLVSISKAGFLGEFAMLFAVSLGYDTCWFGHYKLSEAGKYIEGFSSTEQLKQSTMGYGYGHGQDLGERIICCMPVGKKAEKKRMIDRLAGRVSANRKPLANLLENPQLHNDIPAQIKSALEIAKLAPSAANSQMWRFGFENDFKIITVAKPVGYKHFKWEHPDVDIGMCAAHLWLGLLQSGLTPEIEVSAETDRAKWIFKLNQRGEL